MHGDSSHIRKGTLFPTHSHPTRPYRPSQLHAARWVRWTLTAAMAPVLRSCDRRKNLCTKRRPHRSPRRVRAQRRYPRRRRRVRTVEATREARTTSQLCALHGACAVVAVATTRLRTGRQTGIWMRTMRTTTAPGICAWLAHLRIRGSTRSAIFTIPSPFLAASITPKHPRPNLPPPQQTDSLIFSRPCLSRHRSQFHSHFPPSVLLPCSRTCLTLSFFFLSLFFFDALHCTSACCKLYSILSIFRYYSWGTLCVIHNDYNRTFFWSGPRCVCVCGVLPIIFVAFGPNCHPSLRTKAVFISGRARLASDLAGKAWIELVPDHCVRVIQPRDRPPICHFF